MEIIIVLIVALLCGCIGTSRTAPGPSGFCSKGLGAFCLLTAIFLIFGIFSFVALVGLFYLILGAILQEGACSPLQNLKENLHGLDSKFDLNRFLSGEKGNSPLRVSSVIGTCPANRNIFHVLKANHLFDIGEMERLRFFSNDHKKYMVGYKVDLSKIILLTTSEQTNITKLRFGNLSSYHSKNYVRECPEFTTFDYKWIDKRLNHLANIYFKSSMRRIEQLSFSLHQLTINLNAINEAFTTKISKSYKEMFKIVKEIDTLILYEDRNFNDTISSLLQNIMRSQEFIKKRGKDYVKDISSNLTTELKNMQDNFIGKVVDECNNDVGHCKPLVYIHYQGVQFICQRLVDPINAFWLGILLCALLLLPIIFVAHRLMCLYLIIYPEGSCLCSHISSGAPYVFGGGQQAIY